ncbi:TonB-dependent siderophore receptor [Arcticibacter tournemirensis]
MKKPYTFSQFLCLIILFLSANAFAQTASIKGQITTSDNQPAIGISVRLVGHKGSTLTNSKGEFALNNIAPGTYTLKVSAVGLETQERLIAVKAGATETVNFILNEDLTQLEEVVISSPAKKFAEKKSEYAARMPLNNLENPQVYTVVPKELFVEQISTDLKTALQTVPGLTNITQGVGSGGIGLSIRMRGFSGTNAGGAIRNGMATNWVSLSDPVNLEAIEVIKGPSSTLFGGVLVSYGGLVNRVTKKPFDRFSGSVDYSTGSFGLSRVTADINAPLNDDKTLLFRLNAAYHNEKSFQDYGRQSTQVIAPALTYKVNDKLTLDLDLEFYNTERNTTYIGSIGPNVKAKGFDDLDLDFKTSFTNNDMLSSSKIFNAYFRANYKLSEQWTSQTNYSYANSDNNANYLFLKLLTDSTLSRQPMSIPSTFGVQQFQQNFVGDMKIGKLRNRLLVGLDYSQITSADRRTGQFEIDKVQFSGTNISIPDFPVDIYLDSLGRAARLPANKPSGAKRTASKRNYETYSAYFSDVLNITDQLIAMASLRLDHYTSEFEDYKQTSWSPKFGLVYQVVKDKVSLFGNYMNGFSNVPPQAVYGVGDKVALKPEHAEQLEGGIKLELLSGKLNGTLSYYDIKVDDKTRPDPDHSGFTVQDGTQISRGVEADLIANPFSGLHMIVGYGYNYSKFANAAANVNGLRPTSTPKNTANTWISYKIQDGKAQGLGFGVGGNYQSDAFFVNTTAMTFKVSGYTKLDGTVFYDQSRYRLGVKVNNITDEEYWTTDAWAYRENPRQLIFNISYKF